MKIIFLSLALAILAVVAIGCATGRNGKVKGVTVGESRIQRIFLPKQEIRLPFLARKAEQMERFTEQDLVSATVVGGYLEVLAKIGRVPIRVREGVIFKEGRRWYLDAHVPPWVAGREYYVVDRGTIVCP